MGTWMHSLVEQVRRGFRSSNPRDADDATGTGGTIAGTGSFLKYMKKKVLVVLADPEGSGLYNKVGGALGWVLAQPILPT